MKRFIALCAGFLVVVGATVVVGMQTATADTDAIDFESFSLGSPDGQHGWTITNPNYDVAIADPHAFGVNGMGDRALRISNAVTSGSFGDWAFSSSLANDAGETGADSGGLTSGTRQPHFEVSFDLASAVPGAEQPGLQFSLAPDRGDGARMSFLRFEDSPGGIDVIFADYLDTHPQGPAGACDGSDGFRRVTIAHNLDRSTAHSITLSMDFLNGRANDRVEVWIDGALAGVGTSWEDYFRDCEGNPTRPVDSMIFQARGDGAADNVPGTLGEGFLLDDLTMTSGPIPANHVTGTWSSDTAYSTSVLPPINPTGTSNFPKKRGAIPVQLALLQKQDDGYLESILSDGKDTNDFGYLSFTPDAPFGFNRLDALVAAYEFVLGDCHGGSLRWSVKVDKDGNGTADGNLFIYYGDDPSFTECTGAHDGSGVNMIGASDDRYDLTQLGGPFYGSYAEALATIGTGNVVRASLVLDSGWGGDQAVAVASAAVNDATHVSATTSPTDFVRTCALPPAKVEVVKVDPYPTGEVNEDPISVQRADDDGSFRIVDCKYIYNLDVSALGDLASRAGTYKVYAVIDGEKLQDPAKFDLR